MAEENSEPNDEPNNDDDGDNGNPNREAAKYRTQLRDAEAQRDQLQTTLDARNRAAVERIAAEHLAVPGDIFELGGVELADMLTNEGLPDPKAVREVASAMLEDRPGLAATPIAERLTEAYREHAGARATVQQVDTLQERLETLGDFLDPAAFTGDDGGIDGKRIEQFLAATKPPPVDLGQGKRHHSTRPAGSAWNRLVQGR